MMHIDREQIPIIVVCSIENVLSATIAKVLNVLTGSDIQVISTEDKEVMGEQIISKMPSYPDAPSLIYLTRRSGKEAIARCINTTVFLRNRYLWGGGFIAILPDGETREALDSSPLFGSNFKEAEDEFVFSKLPGHKSLYLFESRFVRSLMEAVTTVGEIGPHAWAQYQAQSRVGEIRFLARKALQLVESGDRTWVPACEAVIELFRNIDWTPLLPHGEILRAANKLQNKIIPKKEQELCGELSQIEAVLDALGLETRNGR